MLKVCKDSRLNERQLRYCLLACTGMEYSEIAQHAQTTRYAVRAVLQIARQKLAALDTTHIPRRLIELGYITIADLPRPVYRASE